MLWAVAQGGVMWLAMARDEGGGGQGAGGLKPVPMGGRGRNFYFLCLKMALDCEK